MAAKITHVEVFRQSLYLLEHGTDRQQQIARFLRDPVVDSYSHLGAVGPDIFYFYHVLSRKKNALGMRWGNLSHHSRVTDLVLSFLDEVKSLPEGDRKKKLTAFTYGYLSHCAVDIVTHPYIFYITGNYYSKDAKEAAQAQANHLRVEYALDAYLLQHRWGMSPNRYNFIQFVDCTEIQKGKKILDYDIWSFWTRSLNKVFHEEFENEYYGSSETIFSGDILNEAYLGFLRFNRLLDTRFRSVRVFLRAVDYATFHRLQARSLILPPREKINPRFLNEEKAIWKYPADPKITSNERFMELVHRAARASAAVLTEAAEYLDGSRKRKDFEKNYSGYNLDTGIRSDSIEMVEFQPVLD